MPQLIYDDSDESAEPRKNKNENKNLSENYDNNEVYVCLKLDKIKELVNKRSSSKHKKTINNEDNEDCEDN